MRITLGCLLAGFLLTHARPVVAQAAEQVELVVRTGRVLRVQLTETTTVHHVGQIVHATLVEPVYVYDRLVLPVGTEVEARIASLDPPSRTNRVRSMLSGDFSPHRSIVLEFGSVAANGERIPIRAVADRPIIDVRRQTARDDDEARANGKVARATRAGRRRVVDAITAAKDRVKGTVASVKDPGRMQRVKAWLIDRSPYHPQFLTQDTVYNAALQAPIPLGTAPARASAPDGSVPAPSSILTAHLTTTLDSATTPRGTLLEAVLTEPVFADDGRLIYPEGTKLTGEVTYAQRARWLHRNGQLRFLFERVDAPNADAAPLLAALHAVDVSGEDAVVLDDEGGAAVTNSKTRFVAPALALLALRGSFEQGEGRGLETPGTAGVRTTSASVRAGNPAARSLGGFFGFGLIGIAVARVSPPVGVALGVVGAVRTVYTNILGKGQEVHFSADTPIEVKLAPGRP